MGRTVLWIPICPYAPICVVPTHQSCPPTSPVRTARLPICPPVQAGMDETRIRRQQEKAFKSGHWGWHWRAGRR